MLTLICGPPASGKTTYVKERIRPRDCILDIDSLYHSLSGLPVYNKPDILLRTVFAAHNAALLQAIRQGITVWCITSGATQRKRDRACCGIRPNEVIILDVPVMQCIKRILHDKRRKDQLPLWEKIIRQWWREYEMEKGSN